MSTRAIQSAQDRAGENRKPHKVVVVLENRFERTPDGKVWSTVAFGHEFWTRYLEVFDEVLVAARVRDVAHLTADAIRSDGPRVTFLPIPYYVGVVDFLKKRRRVHEALKAALVHGRAIIVRAPSILAEPLLAHCQRLRYPYGLEVVGDPQDVFAAGSVRSPLRPLLRVVMPRRLRKQCARASTVAYVEGRVLPKRYPAPSALHQTVYSSIQLHDEAFVPEPRAISLTATIKLISVGSLEQLYKGIDVLIEAIALCRSAGFALRLTVVGDGRQRKALEELARQRDLGELVTFVGKIASPDLVRDQLDSADIFVLPSRAEGLPKALIEAMARGLPCVATNVGGIPELLAEEDMVPPGDPAALAAVLTRLIRDPRLRATRAARNLQVSRRYHDSEIYPKRDAHYRALGVLTQQWTVRATGMATHNQVNS